MSIHDPFDRPRERGDSSMPMYLLLVARQYNETALASLVVSIGLVNLWNRL